MIQDTSTIPAPVMDAITKAFPNHLDAIKADLWHDSLNGCYMFNFMGMLVGVEYDGYIHT